MLKKNSVIMLVCLLILSFQSQPSIGTLQNNFWHRFMPVVATSFTFYNLFRATWKIQEKDPSANDYQVTQLNKKIELAQALAWFAIAIKLWNSKPNIKISGTLS